MIIFTYINEAKSEKARRNYHTNMIASNGEAHLPKPVNDNVLERPQPFVWRLFHGIHYMIGGLTFLIGSCMYFPSVYHPYSNAFVAGGWLFTVGSFFFLLADLQEWWYYRVGCFCYQKYHTSLETHGDVLFRNPHATFNGRYERAEVGINFFTSVCGSALYLAGSILFIPTFENELVLGDWLFIIGSTFIYVSQAWKVYRAGCTNINERSDRRFRLSNFSNNLSALGADTFAGLGGVFYFIGTILFLPSFDKSDSDALRAAILFLCGGTSFTLAGFFLQYHHHFLHHD